MAKIDEKLITFEKIIEHEAIEIRERIREELRRESEERLTGVKEEIRKNAELAYQKDALQAQMERDSRISRAKMNARMRLTDARSDIIASTLSALTQRLAEFTESEAYRGYLLDNAGDSLDGAEKIGAGKGLRLYLTPRDYERFADEIRRRRPGVEILSGGAEMIGGVKVENAGEGLYIDNTLKRKSELCADELYHISGLTIDADSGSGANQRNMAEEGGAGHA